MVRWVGDGIYVLCHLDVLGSGASISSFKVGLKAC